MKYNQTFDNKINGRRRMMNYNLEGIKIGLCQMKVMPGRPDLNTAYILDEIQAAQERGIGLLIFPELCTTGYLIGDLLEDDYFVEDVLRYNRQIVEATALSDVAIVFGTVVVSADRGEDGRQRKHNVAIVAQNGRILGDVFDGVCSAVKTLQPNYRFFNDDKHFYSLRKIAEEQSILQVEEAVAEQFGGVVDLLRPVSIQVDGNEIKLGIIICEDMWHQNYAFNPSQVLAERGAQLIINISASPWTWQKNRRRHQIVKDLMATLQKPLIYVNNAGAQNTGKNIIVFDGSSTVYNALGEAIFEVSLYQNGTSDFIFQSNQAVVAPQASDDTRELYLALNCAIKSMIPGGKKVLVGLSGGIDSAVVCALLVDALGAERVLAINMPMKVYNSRFTRDMADTIAHNLGVHYEVVPIDGLVEAAARASEIESDTLAYENIQARARKEILAAKAQKNSALFVCCSNKIEMAFGYGTLYGDIAGSFAPLGDLVKREVRQIANYLNRVCFQKEVIPQTCIDQIPTAELAKNQRDPFDYGDSKRRGYHDEMVRAFTEFRKNPEWFAELYLNGRLEQELKLEVGTLRRLFKTARDFLDDLERSWTLFQRSFFKRIQAPPIPIISKRAFGRDLEESLMSSYFTRRYQYLKRYLLSQEIADKQQIVIYGGSMNPPAMHHRLIVEQLATAFDKVIVVPCGDRQDKPVMADVSLAQRKEMTSLTFQGIPGVELDFHDLDNGVFTPTYLLAERYNQLLPDAKIWFAVGGDLVMGGSSGSSEIQRSWLNGQSVWQDLNFVVISQPGLPVEMADLPPSNQIIELDIILGRSTTVRERIKRGESTDGLVTPEVVRYITDNGLYRGR